MTALEYKTTRRAYRVHTMLWWWSVFFAGFNLATTVWSCERGAYGDACFTGTMALLVIYLVFKNVDRVLEIRELLKQYRRYQHDSL